MWAGIDVGKEHHWVCVVDSNGNMVFSRKVVNDERTIGDLVAETRPHVVIDGSRHQ